MSAKTSTTPQPDQVDGVYYFYNANWDGTSANKHGGKPWPNHESKVDKADVLRLAAQGIALLKKQAERTIKGTGDKFLLAAYNDLHTGRSAYVNILKGIHQIGSKPHLTARIVGKATLHIWLSTESAPTTTQTPTGNLTAIDLGGVYTYKAAGISASAPDVDKPGSGAIVPACTVIGIRRRNSVSGTTMQALLVSEREKLINMDLAAKDLEESLYGNSAL